MAFRYHINRLFSSVTPKALFRQAPELMFAPSLCGCPCCNGKLTVRKTRQKTIGTLAMGMLRTHETVLECSTCKNCYGSEDLLRLVPHRSRFGYDIIVYIGKSMFLQHRNEQEIRGYLETRGLRISGSEVHHIARKFIIYLAIAHRESSVKLKEHMKASGGYILHLDATCDGEWNSPE